MSVSATRWALLAVAVLVGLAIGLASYTFVYARGYAYLTNEPSACVNCHIMREQYDGWKASDRGHDHRKRLLTAADRVAHVERHASRRRDRGQRLRRSAHAPPVDASARSTSTCTPAAAAASRSGSEPPQQWLMPKRCSTPSAPARVFSVSIVVSSVTSGAAAASVLGRGRIRSSNDSSLVLLVASLGLLRAVRYDSGHRR